MIYERESIKEHINRQLEGNPKDIKDPYNTLHPVNDHNLSLTAQTDLQEKILQDLKSFYQEKYPEDSSDVSHVTHRP